MRESREGSSGTWPVCASMYTYVFWCVHACTLPVEGVCACLSVTCSFTHIGVNGLLLCARVCVCLVRFMCVYTCEHCVCMG